ncbi:MAG: DNA-formamidopyrimidine glycosylase [bacterium]
MPELPEVETIRRFLEKVIIGKKITGVEILSKKQFPQNPKTIIGAKVFSLSRRGKNLIINLTNKKSLLVHLKLSGQLIWAAESKKTLINGNKLPIKSTRVVISFTGGRLYFNEPRKFGWIKVIDQKNLNKELEKIGPEPFGRDFTLFYLQKILAKTVRPIKLVLLDQEKIAGIGNIYANEILFEAGISPQRQANKLSSKEIEALKKAITLILKEGLRYNGSSAADGAYIRPDASSGSYQKHFRVYQRNGKKCFKCNSTIERISLGGRGTFFCAKCQKA